ncbi:lim domain-containing protein wlim1 [Quercus suber]|uniref:Lim domain-containing protein wlim1 n=1 Tax=Quercus suber TaxID=58331 RepID=A0AAW0M8K9_QUESU
MYLVDQLTADSKVYHKACFRCHHCKGTLKVITIKMSLLNIGTHGVQSTLLWH